MEKVGFFGGFGLMVRLNVCINRGLDIFSVVWPSEL